MRRSSSFVAVVTVAVSLGFAPASPGADGLTTATSPNAGSATPRKYPRCKALNWVYPHGVGRVGARDKTSGVPVTTFKRSNRLYDLNKGLDRDKDRIACEKR